MLSFSFNPYTWDGTKERVGSDVVTLQLKNNDSKLIKVSNLTEDIVICTTKDNIFHEGVPKIFEFTLSA